MTLPENSTLQGGKYKIIRFISAGGFGCTYEGYHAMLKKRVAIKEFFVKDFCNRDEKTFAVTVGTTSKTALVNKLKGKFVQEAQTVSSLKHPNIVNVQDIFEENGTAYYVMDYIDGPSLNDILKKEGKMSEQKALRYIRQVADALRYVHSKNRLHLDIKPGNIMVDETDNAILIDFGASKQYDEAAGENTSTLLGMTPGYAPPEQMGNDVVKFTPTTDIYALGATLYKLLTGKTPTSANLRISGEELEPLPSSISFNVRNAVESSMQMNKKLRPQNIDEFLRLLDGKGNGDDGIFVYFVCIAAAVVAVVLMAVLDTKGGSSADFTAESDLNGHECVDLGLSVKWATMNVGANAPEDYGDYFAWGETSPKSDYGWNTYFDSVNGSETDFNKYDIDKKTTLDPENDAAHVNWGGSWRMPTKAELDELREKCTWNWTTQNGKTGYKVTSKTNGNSIFLPAAGFRNGGDLIGVGSIGHFWSSSLLSVYSDSACYLHFYSDYVYWHYDGRYYGFSVRGVCP